MAALKEEAKEKETFKKWLKERQSDPKANKQDLASYLILPVQRIPVMIISIFFDFPDRSIYLAL